MRRALARRGQSMTEMVVIVALVAIATIGAVGFFGNNIRALFGGSSDSLAGNTQVDSNAGEIDQKALHKDMKTFGNNSEIAGGGGSGNAMGR
jgi:Flp pilus assembly pilin Flp